MSILAQYLGQLPAEIRDHLLERDANGAVTVGIAGENDTVHAALATGVHGVGASTIESTTGSASKVSTHAALATGVHNVGGSTVASVADISNHNGLATGVHGSGGSTLETVLGSAAKVTSHAAATQNVHGVLGTKASLILSGTRFDSTIRAKVGGAAGNSITFATLGTNGAGIGVTLGEVGSAVTLYYETGVSTVFQAEALITSMSTLIEVAAASVGGGTLADPGDTLGTTNLANGVDAAFESTAGSASKVTTHAALSVMAAHGVFMSGEQTGNAGEQDIAHGLGSTPGFVVAALTGVPAGGATVSYGVHDGTNVKITCTAAATYKVIAFR